MGLEEFGEKGEHRETELTYHCRGEFENVLEHTPPFHADDQKIS